MKSDKTIERLRSQDRALIREQAMEGGWYGKAKVQIHKNKKDYSRKEKHHNKWDIN